MFLFKVGMGITVTRGMSQMTVMRFVNCMELIIYLKSLAEFLD